MMDTKQITENLINTAPYYNNPNSEDIYKSFLYCAAMIEEIDLLDSVTIIELKIKLTEEIGYLENDLINYFESFPNEKTKNDLKLIQGLKEDLKLPIIP